MPDRAAVYVCGALQIDLGRRELRVGGSSAALGARAFDIAEVLLGSAGELVGKDALMAHVWPGAVVEENTLQAHVLALRKAFARDRDLLQTVYGRGYRLRGTWAIRSDGAVPASPARRATLPRVLPSSTDVPTNLPLAGSALIGRDAAVQAVRDLMSAHRLVTLTGAGGIGKTKLALEVARGFAPTLREGSWLVDLAPLVDPRLVPAALAGAVGLELGGAELSAEVVAAGLAERETLLLLDNCEHVLEAAARLAEAILRICPFVSILATSREPLQVEGEFTLQVPPLAVPPAVPLDATEILGHGAVQLFMARVQAQRPLASADAHELPGIGAICRRLDGLPLAIELAAARVAVLGVEEVAARLDDRFGLLTGGRRTALPRYHTLRATLDWSHDLLAPSEQRVFRRLAAFAGSFTLDAAMAVGRDPGASTLGVEDDIVALAMKSLLSPDTLRGAVRWRLLETTRAYAREMLIASGEAGDVARRHAAYFRDRLTSAAPPTGAAPISALAAEIDDVRLAVDWAFSPAGDAVIGAELTAAYAPVWLHLSLLKECRERVERALAAVEADPALDPGGRGRLRLEVGQWLMYTAGFAGSSGTVLARLLDAAEQPDDTGHRLRALYAMWNYQLSTNGNGAAAQSVAEQFSDVARRSGDPMDALVGNRLIGNTRHWGGDQSAARKQLQHFIDHYVAPDDQRHVRWFVFDQIVLAKATLARVLWLQGRLDRAMRLAHESLRDARATGHDLLICYVLCTTIHPLSLMAGDSPAADRSLAELDALLHGYDGTSWKSWGACLQGTSLIERGDAREGVTLLSGTLATFDRSERHAEFHGILALGLAALDRPAEAMGRIDAALARADAGGQHWFTAELLRIRGELLGRAGDHPEAVRCCVEAAEVARTQDAAFWQLRATLSLAGAMVNQGRRGDARQLLAPICGQFAEGLETPDLAAARALLERLSAEGHDPAP